PAPERAPGRRFGFRAGVADFGSDELDLPLVDFAEALLREPPFADPPAFRPRGRAAGFIEAAARAASSATAASTVSASGSAPFGRDAFTSPCFTYGPYRPA